MGDLPEGHRDGRGAGAHSPDGGGVDRDVWGHRQEQAGAPNTRDQDDLTESARRGAANLWRKYS